MQALTFNKQLTYQTDIAQPNLMAGEALIKLNVAGICATDLELVKGYAGFSGVLGHEFVGTVIAVANNKDQHWLKQRVVGSINIGCTQCNTCLKQGSEHCLHRKVLGIRHKDGVFADFFTLPTQNLFAIPYNVSDAAAVFTEPLAAALRVVEQIESIPAVTIAVLGPGRLGLLIGKVLALAGYQVIMLGRSTSSLMLPAEWQLATDLVHNIPDNSFACVVDATGQSTGFEQALRIVSPQGTLILKSTFSAIEPIDLSKVVVAEINIIGSRCGPFAQALSLLAENKLPITSMIDGKYFLKEGLVALDHAAQSGIRKILLRP
ncbi:MAG: hypothetical protein methR_P0370 [Methyloprofundus sp.]|nr:MAG: hypothetical protein methR_P0370 [Methyloprofundus sp.]